MIEVAGEQWGTAAEIVEHIGQGLTEDAVRWWGRNNGLAKVTLKDGNGRRQARYLLGQAIRIDAAKRLEGRGRKRAA